MLLRNRTLLAVGGLVAVAALLSLATFSMGMLVVQVVSAALFSAALVIATWGLTPAESFVSRNRWGMGVLLVWALIALVPALDVLLLFVLGEEGIADTVGIVDFVLGALGFVLAIAAAVMIWKTAGPTFPRWLRVVLFVGVVLCTLLQVGSRALTLIAATGSLEAQFVFWSLAMVVFAVAEVAVVALGVVLIVGSIARPVAAMEVEETVEPRGATINDLFG